MVQSELVMSEVRFELGLSMDWLLLCVSKVRLNCLRSRAEDGNQDNATGYRMFSGRIQSHAFCHQICQEDRRKCRQVATETDRHTVDTEIERHLDSRY